jgi:integrase
MDSFKQQLNATLEKKAGTLVNGKVAADRTGEAASDALHACFNIIRKECGYHLQRPENIKETHIRAICNYWNENGYKIKTMQGYLSHLRIFCRWIGKGEMVKSLAYYLPHVPLADLRVKTIAEASKSWAANGIDVAEKVREADAIDWRFGMMLRLAVAFGLRRLEIIQCIPWKVDRVDRFCAYKTKGGRPRDIYIDTPEQRKILDQVKLLLNPNEHLGWLTQRNGKKATLEYSLGNWHKMLAKIGITGACSNCTGHGLRAQYAENAALIASVIPPTLGGTGGQMPKDILDLKRAQISELLGHSRKSITGAYFGTFSRDKMPDSPERTKLAIAAAVPVIPIEKLKGVSPERINDCIRLTAELMTAGAYVEPPVTQALWEHHSSRHGAEWLVLGRENIAALEAAANHFVGDV